MCRYDSDEEQVWHDLAQEKWEYLPPTVERLGHLSVGAPHEHLVHA